MPGRDRIRAHPSPIAQPGLGMCWSLVPRDSLASVTQAATRARVLLRSRCCSGTGELPAWHPRCPGNAEPRQSLHPGNPKQAWVCPRAPPRENRPPGCSDRETGRHAAQGRQQEMVPGPTGCPPGLPLSPMGVPNPQHRLQEETSLWRTGQVERRPPPAPRGVGACTSPIGLVLGLGL